MIKFFKSLMKGKGPERIEVREKDLPGFIEGLYSARLGEFTDSCAKSADSIKKICEKTKKDLASFESAELQNKNIPLKEQQFMIGNRQTFIKNTRDFLGKIEDADPEFFEKDHDNIKVLIQQLAEKNKRSYGILQHFFAHETRGIMSNITMIENEYAQLEKKHKLLSFPEIYAVRAEINTFRKRKETLETLRSNMQGAVSRKDQLNKDIEAARLGMKRIQERQGYSEFGKQADEKNALLERIREKETEVRQSFSALSRPLRKFSRLCMDEDLALRLSDDPVAAILQNDAKRIMEMFRQLRPAVEKEQVQVKAKDKVLSAIDYLTEERIMGMARGLSHLRSEKHRIETSLLQNQTMSEYHELSYKSEHLNSKIQQADREVENISLQIEKLQETDSLGHIAENLRKITSDDIVIISENYK